MSQPCKIATFRTTRSVMKADKACKQAGIAARVIAVPPTISSECGMCLRIEIPQLAGFTALMESQAIETKIYDYTFL
jgi:Protein of unknown function (DUF3343).